MAFSFRKIISNINYFKKPDEDANVNPVTGSNVVTDNSIYFTNETSLENFEVGNLEPDSTSNNFSGSLKLPESVKNFAAKKGSLSDTDLLATKVETTKKCKLKSRKLQVDINKATHSNSDGSTSEENDQLENTPKHVLLQCKSSDVFTERIKEFDFKKSFDLYDHLSDEQVSICEDNIDIESLPEDSESDSVSLDGEEIKMCRKVNPTDSDNMQNIPESATPDSFGDMELDNNEDCPSLLLNYQMQLEKIESFLKKLFSDFQFHIEVSKVFNNKSVTNNGSEVDNVISKISKNMLDQVTKLETASRGISPMGSWNLILDQEDKNMKVKVKKQLLTLKEMIEQFVNLYLASDNKHKMKRQSQKSLERKTGQRFRIKKKKSGHGDFPDLTDAFDNLFANQECKTVDTSNLIASPCGCKCHCSQSDSGLSNKTDQSITNQSISSSIGNFSLDSTTLSAFSESLDLIISYNSFDDTSLYGSMFKKPAAERITFYIQVHSIEITSQTPELDFESKNIILFYCPSCKVTENEENGVLKHILSQIHCEKIHFLYKTAYIKKCVASGVEIQPSTVLNPMKMYRDDNKIVCFGDAKYACSLCFENQIIGESVLMGHCSDPEHVNRREMLHEILE